jgi:4-amino-4-deoxy-L-arabinose transferase-like glycosyltransferase
LLGLTGDLLAPGWEDLPRARLGPILLFSLTAALLFHLMASRWGIGAATGAAAAWVFQPNLFGHGHYASYDAVLSCLWVLAIISFANSVATRPQGGGRPGRWATVVVFGLTVGCALATKLTGWFLPVPFLVWAILVRNRRAFVVLAAGLSLAVAVLYLLCPPWWSEPIVGPVRFFQSNLTRGSTISIPVLFLGTVYQTPNESLPWYNTLAWTIMVTPLGFLLLALVGIVRAVRHWRDEPLGLLILGNWALLMVLRAMPHTPGHDGVRLFLPAFGVLAMFVGLGVRSLWARWPVWARLALAAAVSEGLLSVIVMMPVPLSYFSPVVGGLPGAARLGMEPTYYWDALDDQARAWLREHTPAGRTIHFATNPTSWRYLRQVGQLPPRIDGIDPGYPAWYVMQNRPGAWLARDLAHVRRSTLVFAVRKLGVPLVWVFPYALQAMPDTSANQQER